MKAVENSKRDADIGHNQRNSYNKNIKSYLINEVLQTQAATLQGSGSTAGLHSLYLIENPMIVSSLLDCSPVGYRRGPV